MSAGHCSCPDCGTILRIRDRSFIGRSVNCPDCHVKLVIQQNDDRQMFAEKLKSQPTPAVASRPTAVAKVSSTLVRRIRELAGSPLVLAWALAFGVMTFAAILMLRPAVRFRNPVKTAPDFVQVPPEGATSTKPPADRELPEQQPEEPPVVIPPETIAQQTTPEPAKPPEPAHLPVAEVTSVDPAAPPKVTTVPPEVKATVREPAPVQIDIEALMKQRVQKITTDKPNTRQQMLELVEEMLGVPIRYNPEELGVQNLDRPVTIDLESTTVGGVLKALLDAANWEYVIEKNEVRIKPKQVADTASR
ncbi:MAG: STN domain-containing protein [Planctomycetes bacterium]|nr:STN domain-containing protein [Planctomycetota bacterium]